MQAKYKAISPHLILIVQAERPALLDDVWTTGHNPQLQPYLDPVSIFAGPLLFLQCRFVPSCFTKCPLWSLAGHPWWPKYERPSLWCLIQFIACMCKSHFCNPQQQSTACVTKPYSLPQTCELVVMSTDYQVYLRGIQCTKAFAHCWDPCTSWEQLRCIMLA